MSLRSCGLQGYPERQATALTAITRSLRDARCRALPRIPKFDPPRQSAGLRGVVRRWAIDLSNERWLLTRKEVFDARQGRQERAGKVRKRRCADDHQQPNAVPHDCVAFVRFVANAAIMGERDLATFADFR
jgi:hypothetical protein